jgi:hypothetical protein
MALYNNLHRIFRIARNYPLSNIADVGVAQKLLEAGSKGEQQKLRLRASDLTWNLAIASEG